MKLSFNSILYSSGLFALVTTFVNAVETNLEDTAVSYFKSDTVDIGSHTDCIPLANAEKENVADISFGISVVCHTYASSDCTGPAQPVTGIFNEHKSANLDFFEKVWPKGSVKCQ